VRFEHERNRPLGKAAHVRVYGRDGLSVGLAQDHLPPLQYGHEGGLQGHARHAQGGVSVGLSANDDKEALASQPRLRRVAVEALWHKQVGVLAEPALLAQREKRRKNDVCSLGDLNPAEPARRVETKAPAGLERAAQSERLEQDGLEVRELAQVLSRGSKAAAKVVEDLAVELVLDLGVLREVDERPVEREMGDREGRGEQVEEHLGRVVNVVRKGQMR